MNISSATPLNTYLERAVQADGRVWVLSESAERSTQVRQLVLRSLGLRGDTIWCVPVSDGILKIAKGALEEPIRRLTELQAGLLVRHLLTQEPFLELGAEERPDSIKRFIDVARTTLATERLMKGALDEFGNVLPSALRVEKLLYLLNAYQAYQREHSFFDAIGLLEITIEILNDPKYAEILCRDVLPATIVCDNPTFFTALAAEFWLTLAAKIPVAVTLPPRLVEAVHCEDEERILRDPGIRSASRVVQLLRAHRKRFEILEKDPRNSRIHLVHTLFAGAAGLPPDEEATLRAARSVRVFSCADERTEARHVAQIIADELEGGECEPSDIVVVPLRHAKLLPLLREELTLRGVPVTSRRGALLCSTVIGSLFQSLLDWVESPCILRAAALWSSPSVRPPKARPLTPRNKALLRPLLRLWKHDLNELGEVSPELLEDVARRIVVGRHVLDAPLNEETLELLVARLARYYAQLSVPRVRRGELFHEPRQTELGTLIFTLAYLQEEAADALRIVEERSLANVVRGLRVLLSSFRLRSRPPIELSDADRRAWKVLRENHVLGTRRIRQFLEEIRALARFEAQLGEVRAVSAFHEVVKRYRESAAGLSTRFRARDGAVRILTLEETRGIDPKLCIVTSLCADSYPMQSVTDIEGQGAIGEVTQYLRRAGREESLFDAYYLLGELLCESDDVVLTYPEEDERGGVEAHPLVHAISTYKSEATNDESSLERVPRPKPCIGSQFAECERPRSLVLGRAEHQFTSFDGLLGAEFMRGTWTQSYSSLEPRTYSPTALDTLADCAHRFYFRHLLRLHRREAPGDAVQRHVGTVVHEALKRFYSQPGITDADFTPERFQTSCQKMARIAEEVFEESEFDWSGSYELQFARDRVVAGLNEDYDYTGRRGALRVALEIQGDLLKHTPSYVEFPFGVKPENRVAIPGCNEETLLRGVVDRIDIVENAQGEKEAFIWDYKVKGRLDPTTAHDLQLAVYAHAVQSLLPEVKKIRGTGVILLNAPCHSRELYRDEPQKIRIFRLDKGRGKKSEDEREGVTPETLQEFFEKIRNLDGLVKDGNFVQRLESRACDYCEFRGICGRNTSRLVEILHGEKRVLFAQRASIESEQKPKRTKRAYTPLNPEQEAACDTASNVVLIAGAGSGKTHVLQTRILRLLKGGAPLDSIVAITFTEKAALEIRLRVEEALIDALASGLFEGAPLSHEELGRFRDARAMLPLAPIGTIHSFCQRILCIAGAFAESGMVILPQNEQVLLIQEAVERTLDASDEDTVAARDWLFHYGLSPYDLEGVVRSLTKNARAEARFGSFCASLRALSQREQHERIVQLCRDIRTALVPVLRSRWLVKLREWLESSSDSISDEICAKLDGEESALRYDLLRRVERVVRALADGKEGAVLELSELRRYVLDMTPTQAKSKKGRNPFKTLKPYVEELKLDVFEEQNGFESADTVRFAFAVAELGQRARRRYEAAKSIRNAVDFDDLVLHAHALVCENNKSAAALRDRLRRRFRHFLVDEFQDTDPEQWELIRSLALPAEAPTNGESQCSLFVVGDPQQAIYGFRSGDVRVFQRSVQEVEARGGKLLRLQNNYRSHPGILEFTNATFQTLLRADFTESGAPRIETAVEFQPLRPARTKDGLSQRVLTVRTARGEGRLTKEELRGLESENVARLIKGALAGDPRFDGLGRYPSAQSIAVLARTNAELLSVARALGAEGVPFSFAHSKEFFELDEVRQLENLVRTLAYPHDTIALVGVLRSALIGLNDRELATLGAVVNGRWRLLFASPDVAAPDGIGPEELDLWRYVHSRLTQWQHLSRHATASQLLEVVQQDCRFEALYSQLPPEVVDGEGAYLNILRCIDLLRSAELRGGIDGSLRSAVQWFDTQRLGADSSPNAYRGSHPVVLSTIHGSKGLEFPMVVLPFLQWGSSPQRSWFEFGEAPAGAMILGSTKGRDDDPDASASMFMTWLRESGAAQQRAEARRLFYVACTRAREYLVLSLMDGRTEGVAPGSEQFMDLLFESPSAAAWLASLLTEERSGEGRAYRLAGYNEIIPVV